MLSDEEEKDGKMGGRRKVASRGHLRIGSSCTEGGAWFNDIVNFFFFADVIERWSLSETFIGLGIVLAIYLILVLKILPNYMKDRQPYSLKSILTKYNAFQVLSSVYIVYLVRSFNSFFKILLPKLYVPNTFLILKIVAVRAVYCKIWYYYYKMPKRGRLTRSMYFFINF